MTLGLVYYIPGINLNVFSFSVLHEQDVGTTIRNRKCTLTNIKYNVSFGNIFGRDSDGLFVTKIVSPRHELP